MTATSHFRKLSAIALASAALAVTAIVPSAVHAAEQMNGDNEKQTQFHGDGDVDGRDFLVWQRNTSAAPISTGDLADWQTNFGTGPSASDGDVDGRDFLIWQRGSSPAPASDGVGEHEVGHWMGLYTTH